MKEPKIAAKHPSMQSLGPGTYFWCACGRSANQPFCDGSHRGTEHTPVQFKIDNQQDVWLCQCKHSENKPFCDGSHRDL
jgi:CDGSH-type Zn-finger protein